ncbi:MAG TPA: histone deacetylase [Gemmatimonadales bacterium]|nr:histone deacetylase [Gemmatimonadales bacterium]
MSLRAWSSARWTVPLPPGHRFPIAKYALIRDAVVAAGLLPAQAIEEPGRVSVEALQLVHEPAYVTSILDGTLDPVAARRLGFPWTPELRERSMHTVQGTLEAAHDALDRGAGINLAGGTHHAFADRGEGFCVFNDVAIAVRWLQRSGMVRNVAIVDLDVHQGNGTARLFEDDPDIFTFSMHGDNNYPFHKESSRLDVGLPDGCDDSFYIGQLAGHLGAVLDAAKPDLVCYLGGADPYLGDRFGRLRLSIDGLRRRDHMVFETCARRGLPVVMTLAGGYAADLQDIATIHLNTVRELLAYYG